MSDPARKLEFELRDAQVLIEQIRTIAEDDETLVLDTIEGQTNILELIALVDAAEFEDQANLTAIGAFIEKLGARKDRIKKRIDMKRAVLANALNMIGKKKHETPLGTISISQKPVIAIVTDEAEIPARFWKPQPPTLDKAALNAAIKANETIPGATESNGGITISIRR